VESRSCGKRTWIRKIIEGEQQAMGRAAIPYRRAGAVGEDLAIGKIVEREQQAITRASIPYMESRSFGKRTWLSVRS
jgi:hypothetical protein